MKEYLNILFSGNSLNAGQAEEIMDLIIEGNVSNEQIAAMLGALRVKKETVEEITGFVRSIRKNALNFETKHRYILDVCGTGGDGSNTFNISTASAFVISGAGIPVAKHGNKAISSKCGSSDVLKELGIKIELTPERAKEIIDESALGFLFAPNFHPALKKVAPVRQALGLRTVFNLLGPLSNPAGVKRQIVGVYDISLIETIAGVLLELGTEEAIVLSSEDGMDEVSVSARTKISHLKDGRIFTSFISPEDFGLPFSKMEELKGGTPQENAVIIENILKGEKGAKRNSVLINSAVALYISGQSVALNTCFEIAKESIDSGKAYAKLEQMRKY